MQAADDVAAQIASLLERISAAERRAAEHQVSEDNAETEYKAVSRSRDAALSEASATKATCQTLQRAAAELQTANETIAKRAAEERTELAQRTEEALSAATKEANLRMEAHEKAVREDNKALEERIEQFRVQLDASAKHWEAETRMKHLEEQLLIMRLEEADGKLREARRHQQSSAGVAEEVKKLRQCEKQWAELESVLARTDEAVTQHDEQVASVGAEADALEAERDVLTTRLAKTVAKRDKLIERTLPGLAARLAAVEDEQQKVKEECRELQRALSTKGV